MIEDQKSYLGLILFFSLAMVVSFLCSLLEAVMLTVSHAYIETLVNSNRRSGRILKKLKAKIDRPLAAILTFNTIANTVGAAGVGAETVRIWGNRYLGLASGILTFSILIFSEIIPKTVGAVHTRKFAPVSAYLIRGLIVIAYPLVLASEQLSQMLRSKKHINKVSREEMMASAEMAHHEGTLHIQESRIIRNLLQLQHIRAKDVLTPRSVLLAFSQQATVGDIIEKHSPIRFSRIPVYGKDLDDITGFVHRYKILQTFSEGNVEARLQALAKPVHAIPDVKSIASTLDEFIHRREHIFLVVDEYGGTAGLITLEDAVETLLGVEIVDEYDTVEDMRKLAIRLWEQRKKQHEL